ncbi:MAG: ParB N-terminal domain-containing protein [Oscillospiraceae bacterium]|nr:ParB N-terminal domain-containing protein [Oscillospiraceae bacterium]
MKYENGKDIFPDNLLRQIQKYVSGRLIYIPARDEKRSWGETSGYKQYLSERNREIKEKFVAGAAIDDLAEKYFLAPETIKKILYSKKEESILDYKCSLSSSKEYAKSGKLEEWIHTYLHAEGHNKEFSDGLKLFDRFFIGPIKIPLSLLKRCCGPEEDMRYRVSAEWFEKKVSSLMDAIKTEKDMPPLIVHYVDHDFELNDGNHRLEAYKRLGIEECHVIVWTTEKEEYDEFSEKFSEYLS